MIPGLFLSYFNYLSWIYEIRVRNPINLRQPLVGCPILGRYPR